MNTVEAFTVESKFFGKGAQRLRNRTGAMNLGINNSSPVFFMEEVSNVGIRIIHVNGGGFDMKPSLG